MEIGGYSDIRLIGSGGLGDVYRARRDSTGGLVAIKVVRTTDDRDAVERRTRREVEALLALKSHPHVVQVEEIVTTPTGPALVMEYIEGGSLNDLTRHGPLGPAAALFAIKGVASALVDAHRRGIIHRDIKPHNVLVSSFGQPKVCDFGIAAIASSRTHLDQTGSLSYRYASPEEQDEDQKVDSSTDVYSAGVTLRQLLTGETIDQKARNALATKGLSDWLGPAEQVALDSLMGLVTWMTSHQPARRPSAQEVARRLEMIEAELGAERVVRLSYLTDNIAEEPTETRNPTGRGTSRSGSRSGPPPMVPHSLPDLSSVPDIWWR